MFCGCSDSDSSELLRSRLPLISSSTSLRSCSAFRLMCGSGLATKASSSTSRARLALSIATFSLRFSNLALRLNNLLSSSDISRLWNILSRASLSSPWTLPCAITGLTSGGGVLPTEWTSGGISGSTSLKPELEDSEQSGVLLGRRLGGRSSGPSGPFGPLGGPFGPPPSEGGPFGPPPPGGLPPPGGPPLLESELSLE